MPVPVHAKDVVDCRVENIAVSELLQRQETIEFASLDNGTQLYDKMRNGIQAAKQR